MSLRGLHTVSEQLQCIWCEVMIPNKIFMLFPTGICMHSQKATHSSCKRDAASFMSSQSQRSSRNEKSARPQYLRHSLL